MPLMANATVGNPKANPTNAAHLCASDGSENLDDDRPLLAPKYPSKMKGGDSSKRVTTNWTGSESN